MRLPAVFVVWNAVLFVVPLVTSFALTCTNAGVAAPATFTDTSPNAVTTAASASPSDAVRQDPRRRTLRSRVEKITWPSPEKWSPREWVLIQRASGREGVEVAGKIAGVDRAVGDRRGT